MSSENADASEEGFGYRHGLFLFLPDSLGLHVDGTPEQYPLHGDEPWPDGGSSRTAVYMHEEDHLLRTVGTSAGLMAHAMNGRVLDSYLRALSVCDLCRLTEETALPQAIRRALRLPPGAEHPHPELFVLGADRDLARVLLGVAPSAPGEVVQRSAVRHWGRRLGIDEGRTDLMFRPPNPRYPGQSLDARSLVETLGIMKESIYQNPGGDLVDSSVEYSFALSYAKAELEGLFDWEVQPIEVEAALSLALWPPLTPQGFWPSREYRWEDVEPGHRFRALVERLRDLGNPLTGHNALDDAERDAFFGAFFRTMCDALAWPTPEELADAWLDHLRAAKPWGRTDAGWWNLGHGQFRTQRAIRFLESFKARPFYSAYQEEASRGIGSRIRFAYVAYPRQIQVQEADLDAGDDSTSARLDGDVFLGMSLILDDGARTPRAKAFVERHLRLLPRFVPELDDRRRFDGNLEFLKGLYLSDEA